jgi:hypothetical protein
MLYQLPNGKVISMTIDEYLDLTDYDIQFLMSINAGEYANSPWVGSAIRNSGLRSNTSTNDKTMDYVDHDEDKSHGDNPSTNEIYLDELPDVPDPDTLDQ